MRKWLWIALIVLSVLGISRFFTSDNTSLIRVHIYPTAVYWEGRQIAAGEKRGTDQEGAQEFPSVLEYRGTLYVPLDMVGRQLNKPVGWDSSSHTAWVGQPPAAEQPAAVQASAPPAATQVSEKALPKAEGPATNLFGVSLGMPSHDVVKLLGKPARQEPSALGYQWWVFNANPARYLQVGIADGKVVDLYSNAPEAKLENVGIGTSLASLSHTYDLQNTVLFSYMSAQIQITNQKQQRPLVMNNGVPLIFYLDKQNDDKVTALRIIDTHMLLRGGFYETKWSYRGQAPNFDPPAMSVKDRELVNAAYERQVLDLVNVSRYRYKLPPLEWNERAAEVARKHSLDMDANGYFDHVSATTGSDPFDRLKQANIKYKMAGENIAAGYTDAIEAHESWMNSPGHRKNVLEKGFSQLGVGVISDYYTETFLTPLQ